MKEVRQIAIIGIWLLFLQVDGFSQKVELKRKLSVGLVFSPDCAYRVLKKNDSLPLIFGKTERGEVPVLLYTVGVRLEYEVFRKVSLELGLNYCRTGYNTADIPLRYYKVYSEPHSNAFSYRFGYLDIPVKLKFYFIKRRLGFFATAGGAQSVFLHNQSTVVYKYYDGRQETRDMYKDVKYYRRVAVGIFELGIDLAIGKKVRLLVAPGLRCSLLPINVQGSYSIYLYNLGLQCGFRYGLD